jgi:periplasmic protein TonB
MTDRQLIPVNFPDQGARTNVWKLAAAVALCGHLAFAAFAFAQMREDPEDDELGAPGIEVAFEMAALRMPPSDSPPGPESEASAASPAVAEQKVEVKEVDRPKETPVEAEQPDRVVALDAKPVVEEEPEIQTAMVRPSEESVAQEATSAPAIQNAPEAVKSTTREQGSGQSQQRARVTWQRELLAHLNKYKRYPTHRSQKDAQIMVALTLDRTGRVLATRVTKSSGDAAFDQAALTMVERASPVPAPPPLIADEGLSFFLPVNFRKNGR